MSKLVSVKKLEANRRNAQRSTGPKTVEGKNAVKLNALKHGLLAKAAILPQEDRAEYERLLAGLAEHYQPVGMLEALLVEDIAYTFWRRRRAVRAEAAEIQAGMITLGDKAQSILTKIGQEEAARNIQELVTNSAGLRRLSEVFDDMAREIRQDGKLSAESIEWLMAHEHWSQEELNALRGAATVTEAAKKEAAESLRRFIASAQKAFRRQIKVIEPQEAAVRDMAMARAGVLQDSMGEAILRYERVMDKKLDMLIARLERLQRQRRETAQPTSHVAKTA
jgi:hypothetical protein